MKTKKLALSCMFVAVAAISSNAQQLPNNNFEGAWVNCVPWTSGNNTNAHGTQPTGWVLSNVIGITKGSMIGNGKAIVGAEDANGHTGKAVKINNSSAGAMSITRPVPGYLTLGKTWSTTFIVLSDPRDQDGGTWGGINFSYRPDAVSFWYKDTRKNASEQSTVVAYLWNGTAKQAEVAGEICMALSAKGDKRTKVTMIDRERNILGMQTAQGGAVSGDHKLIAKIDQYLTGNVANWTEQVIDFNYVDQNAAPQKFNIIFSAGNYWSASPVEGNELYIDDVTLLYYSRLSDLKVNGATVAGFDSKTFEYNFLEKVPALSSVVATKMGNAPKNVSTELAANGSDILVTVANQAGANDFDGKSTHTYTLSYMNDVLTGATTVFNQQANSGLVVDQQKLGQKIYLKKDNNGKYTVTLPGVPNYGTIKVDNIVSTNGKDFDKTTANVQLEDGRTATVAIKGISQGEKFLYSYSVTVNGNTQIVSFTNDTNLSGVESVETLNEKVIAKIGAVEVQGVNGNVSVYTVDGRLVKYAVVNGEAEIELANGLYIVRTPKTATKVLVK